MVIVLQHVLLAWREVRLGDTSLLCVAHITSSIVVLLWLLLLMLLNLGQDVVLGHTTTNGAMGYLHYFLAGCETA